MKMNKLCEVDSRIQGRLIRQARLMRVPLLSYKEWDKISKLNSYSCDILKQALRNVYIDDILRSAFSCIKDFQKKE